MELRSDSRGQSIQIGAVLLFGILIIFLSIWQAFVVPNQNEEVEFNHNQDVQQELTELRGTVNSMTDATSTRSTTLDLGARYPSRSIFVNPPPASGTIQTIDTTDESVNISFANVTAAGETGDFWNDTEPYNTGSIAYEPDYNLYANAPETVYENSLLYNDFTDGNTLSLTGQSIVDDDRITLVALNGSYSDARVGSTSVDLAPISTATRTIQVTNSTAGPLTIQIPTRLGNETWEEILRDEQEFTDQNGHVRAVEDGPAGTVEISFEQGTDYDLRLAKVGVGTQTTDTEAAYITDIEGDGAQPRDDETREVTVEVRDPYNGPMQGVAVNASAELDADFGDGTKRTDSDGQVTFNYRADGTFTSDQSDQLNFTIQDGYDPQSGTSHEADTPANLTMDVSVQGTDIDDGTGNGSPVGLEWIAPNLSEKDDNYTFRFNRTAGDDNQTQLTVQTVPAGIDQLDVDFAANSSSISLEPQKTSTGAQGNSTVTLTADTNQTVAVYAFGGGGGDVVNVTVINTTSDTPSNADPSASFTASPDPANTGETISLDASGSSDSDGTISSYDWDTDDDGNYDDATGSSASVSYPSSGDKTISLRVTDDGGATDTTSQTVTVKDTGATQSYPGEYNDNSNDGSPQNDSIPPVTAKGNLRDFSVLQSDSDGQRAQFSEVGQAGNSGNNQQLEVGLAFRDLASGDHKLALDYQIVNGRGETFELVLVNASGNEIDGGSTHELTSTTRTTTSFNLSTAESDYIDSNGEIFVVVRDNRRGSSRDNLKSTVYMDYIEIALRQ